MTRWMARYTGFPPTPGPAHAIRPRPPGIPSWRSPMTYCRVIAESLTTSRKVTWRDVTNPTQKCPRCVRRMPKEPTP